MIYKKVLDAELARFFRSVEVKQIFQMAAIINSGNKSNIREVKLNPLHTVSAADLTH